MKNQIYTKRKKKKIYSTRCNIVSYSSSTFINFLKVENLNEELFLRIFLIEKVDKILIKHNLYVNVWIQKKFFNHLCKKTCSLVKNKINIFYLANFIFDIGYLQRFVDQFYIDRNIYELYSILIFKNKEGYKIKKFIFYYLFFFCGSFLFKRIVKKVEESNIEFW